jgi:hypothetical protein
MKLDGTTRKPMIFDVRKYIEPQRNEYTLRIGAALT